jgi:hypothetical protein
MAQQHGEPVDHCRRFAFILGNGQYLADAQKCGHKFRVLSCSSQDARRMAEEFQHRGFRVTLLHNLRADGIRTHLAAFVDAFRERHSHESREEVCSIGRGVAQSALALPLQQGARKGRPPVSCPHAHACERSTCRD